MNTTFLLLARYNKELLALEDICEEYFACSRHTAIQRAKSKQLPVKCFQIGNSQKSPWFVHVSDLANLIDERREEASQEWHKAS